MARGQVYTRLPIDKPAEWEKVKKRYLGASLEELEDMAKEYGFRSRENLCKAMRGFGLKRSTGQDASIPSKVSAWKPGDVRDSAGAEDQSRIAVDVANGAEHRLSEHYKRLYKLAIDELQLRQSVEETIKLVAGVVPPITVQTMAPRKQDATRIKAKGSETDVLQLSDIHGMEVVRKEETLGMNEYNPTIMNRRLDMCFRKVVELVELRRGSLFVPKLVIAEEGDMVSGEIHDELVSTNVERMMIAAVRVASLIAQGIAYLAPHFDQIDVVCVPGNHARLTKKTQFKEHYINWDYMCYQWQAVFCKALANVRFIIPKSPFELYTVENSKLLLYHGDNIQSWNQVPWYGIERADMKLTKLFEGADKHYDAILMGHFHRRFDMDTVTGPIICNGSVKGGDEFALGKLMVSNAPSQNLLYFHSKHGYIGGGPILLHDADHDEKLGFNDTLPDVWAEIVSSRSS